MARLGHTMMFATPNETDRPGRHNELSAWEQQCVKRADAAKVLNRKSSSGKPRGKRIARVRMSMRGSKVATSRVIGRHRDEKLGMGA